VVSVVMSLIGEEKKNDFKNEMEGIANIICLRKERKDEYAARQSIQENR